MNKRLKTSIVLGLSFSLSLSLFALRDPNAPPVVPNCVVTPLPLYAPWWVYAQTDNLDQMFQLPAAGFSGVPSGCWEDMIVSNDEEFFSEVDFGYFYPAPRNEHTVRIFFLYPPKGGYFELRHSIDGVNYRRYLRLYLTPCSSSKDQWIWIEVPEFQGCSAGDYEVIQLQFPD